MAHGAMREWEGDEVDIGDNRVLYHKYLEGIELFLREF